MAIRKPARQATHDPDPEPREATPAEWRDAFDAECQADLAISREECLRRFDAGEFTSSEAPDLRAIFMHHPFDSVR